MPDTQLDTVNLLAGQAVGCAASFLDGRRDVERLALDAAWLSAELMVARDAGDLAVNAILDPARLLVVAMTHTARVTDEARAERWRQVMGSLITLVRAESLALRPRAEPTGELLDESGFSAGFDCGPPIDTDRRL
jgi:hypothetical protein